MDTYKMKRVEKLYKVKYSEHRKWNKGPLDFRDKSLDTHHKLAIKAGPKHENIEGVSSHSPEELIRFAISHIPQEFLDHEVWGPVVVSAAHAIFVYGIYSMRSKDTRVRGFTGPNKYRRGINTHKRFVKKMAVIIGATKINLFKMNHHIGNYGSIDGELHKTICRTLGKKYLTIKGAEKVFHMIGHWADTRKIFNVLNIKGVKGIYFGKTYTLRTMSFMKELFSKVELFPAGTADVEFCYKAVQILMNHPLNAKFNCDEMTRKIYESKKYITWEPIGYHINAKKYAAVPKKREQIRIPDNYVAVLRSYIKVLHRSSVLAKSNFFKMDSRNISNEEVESISSKWLNRINFCERQGEYVKRE